MDRTIFHTSQTLGTIGAKIYFRDRELECEGMAHDGWKKKHTAFLVTSVLAQELIMVPLIRNDKVHQKENAGLLSCRAK
jgi:hypothetical protein